MEKKTPQYKVGISLSGGGAKGIAHLGVLQAMEDLDMKPEIISGVSAGAIIGALYADGKTPQEILKFFLDSSFFKFVSIVPKKGFMSTNRFKELLSGFLTAKTFEELQIPLIINATELLAGKNEFFSSGPLVERVVASASVPVVLNPAEMDGKLYVDGGIFCNMPVKVIRPMCETLVGVHVNPILDEGSVDNVKDVLERVYHLVIQANTVSEKKACDIVIEPIKARNFGMFEISKSQQIFDIGYAAAMEKFAKSKIINHTLK